MSHSPERVEWSDKRNQKQVFSPLQVFQMSLAELRIMMIFCCDIVFRIRTFIFIHSFPFHLPCFCFFSLTKVNHSIFVSSISYFILFTFQSSFGTCFLSGVKNILLSFQTRFFPQLSYSSIFGYHVSSLFLPIHVI